MKTHIKHSTDMPFVSIVIPVYNGAHTIGSAISACLSLDYPAELIEIIVVDDGSTDKTRHIVQQYPVTYIFQENAGPAKARNCGCHHAKGSIVAFLDSDCIPRRHWVRKMISQYTSDDIVCVGSRYGIANPESFLACLIYFEFLIRYKRMPRHPKFLGSHGYSFRKDFLERIGGYDESYSMASHEDNELAYRIFQRGFYTVFDKSNIVEHRFPTSLLKYLRIQMWHGYWRMKNYVDHPRMVTGDDYSDVWDYMQPPMAALFMICVLFSWIPFVRFMLIVLFILGIVVQLPIALSIVRLCRRKRYFFYIPFGMLRACARSIGMFIGLVKFWILRYS